MLIGFFFEASANSDLDELKITLNNKYKIINKGIKRNIYTILDTYKSDSQALLLKKWFRVASQVTYNDSLAIFIRKTNIKVKALTTQLIFSENNAISELDKDVLQSKFNFLYKYAKETNPINTTLYIRAKDKHGKSGNLFLRTMPIVDKLTTKKYGNGNFITLEDKSMVTLLYKINFQLDSSDSTWGYVESPVDGRIGWINLNYTKERR